MKKESLLLVILISVLISGCTDKAGDEPITSFEQCVNAGYPVAESYPRQCTVPGGNTFTELIEEPIGGDRDGHGCLGPAGYAWSEEAGACIRPWELDDDQKKAAKIAVDDVGHQYATTIIEVVTLKCPGCFIVKMEQGEQRDMLTVYINDWKAKEKTITRHTCAQKEKDADLCTMEYAPVCGFKPDGTKKTYGNGCTACKEPVDYWENGECEQRSLHES